MPNVTGEFGAALTESLAHLHGWKPSARKPRDPGNIQSFHGFGSVGEGKSRKADMHVVGESDRPIVPEKSMNKKRKTRQAKASNAESSAASLFDGLPTAESMEGGV